MRMFNVSRGALKQFSSHQALGASVFFLLLSLNRARLHGNLLFFCILLLILEQVKESYLYNAGK